MRTSIFCSLFIVLTCSSSFIACSGTKAAADGSETIVDLKKRLWKQLPTDRAVKLDKAITLDLNQLTMMGRPTSFLISNNNSILLNDNTNGKLYQINSDLKTIKEFTNSNLTYPTRIRENQNKIFVYDNGGINVFSNEGMLQKVINPFLKIEDFIPTDDSLLVTLSEPDPKLEPNLISTLNFNGKREESFAQMHDSEYGRIENKSMIETDQGNIFVCYRFTPLFEIYDKKSKKLINSFDLKANFFPSLLEVKKDKSYVNPSPGIYKLPKYSAGFKIFQGRIFVLLHTPNPEIIEFTLDGKEVQRYLAPETEVTDYFGFDIRLNNDAKQFFVGTIDASGKPFIFAYQETQNKTGE